jgi:hypothetical protein
MRRAVLLAALVLVLAVQPSSQSAGQPPQPAEKSTQDNAPQKAAPPIVAVEEVPVPAEMASELQVLNTAFTDAVKARDLAQAQLDNANLKLAGIRATLLAQFNRLCAKSGKDPDEWEWNSTYTGIRRKAPPEAAAPASKEGKAKQ